MTSRYSFALTSISFKDFPFLYEISGGSLNISLSNGWFSIKCHLLIKMVLRLDNTRWYVEYNQFQNTSLSAGYPHYLTEKITSEVKFAERKSALEHTKKVRNKILPLVVAYRGWKLNNE